MRNKKYNILLLVVTCLLSQTVCSNSKVSMKTSTQFADSEMKRFPHAWQLDHGKKFVWGYAQGVGCCAMLKVWKNTQDRKYFDYVHEWADYMVLDNGSIRNYSIYDYNIDWINSGKILFDVYRESKQEKFRMAMDTLLNQLKTHPQTSDSVFWHKKIYPHQIWLDGIYMAGPFMAQYGKEYNRPDLIDKAMHELVITYKHTLDKKTGLLYHAYDESREQRWANKKTGQSPNFWGRAIGWYYMALVDIMDFVPENHPQRKEVIAIITHLSKILPRYQDKTGLWYQVIDQGNRKGNYLEASVSSMFMYSIAKAVNKGYINKKNLNTAIKAYNGIMNQLMIKETDETLSLTQCCAVSGLGGNPYRDGSFEYYVNEKIRNNDSKATGPFIMACLELEKTQYPAEAVSDFCKNLKPVGRILESEGYYVWCCAPIYDEKGKVHVFYSRWPEQYKMGGWIRQSEIAHAVANRPEGPYKYVETILRPRPGYFDATTCHNPHIQYIDGTYYLFYIGNSDGTVKTKSIGLATSQSINGPWKRTDKPLLTAGTTGAWDDCCATNPSFLKTPDGTCRLYYKSWNKEEYNNQKGSVRANRKYGLAISERIDGDYSRYEKNPIVDFSVYGNNIQVEDAYIWMENGKYFMLMRDMGYFDHTVGLIFESENGLDWSEPQIAWYGADKYDIKQAPAPKHLQRYGRFERPQLLMKNGKPEYLFTASQGGKHMTASGFIFKIK